MLVPPVRTWRPASARGFAALLGLLLPVASAAQAPRGGDLTLGSGDAPIVVVEFLDFGCSACRQFATETFDAVRREHIGTGQVHWTAVPFELGAFRNSRQAAVAALCAAEQGAFWPMHDRIFRDQAEWQDTRKPEPLFLEMFRDMGLDAGAYESCRGDDEVEDLVKDLRKRARESGIRATPAFLVNGNLVFGAFSLEQFREVLEEHGPTP